MLAITLDVETLPDMRPGARETFIEDARTNVRAPSDMTKEQALNELGITDASERKFTSKDAALARWCERFGAEQADSVGDANWRKTSFDATQGHLCCIGWAIDDEDPVSVRIDTIADEREMLASFFSALRKSHQDHSTRQPLFIGHNHVGFDLPFIFRRAVILGVEPPMFLPQLPKAWDDSVFDTMVQWAGHGNRISMDNLCAALGIPGKDGMDGSMVCDAFIQGRIEDIATYCRQDVERTRAIYRRLTFYQAPTAAASHPSLEEPTPPWLLDAA